MAFLLVLELFFLTMSKALLKGNNLYLPAIELDSQF